mmetsp:Transcript_25618/g.57037  ORF Transcript_25618/g.57037 Transcript_25618/m.57037 type:complete len:382 (-) Transcript_25618:236-1381(-)
MFLRAFHTTPVIFASAGARLIEPVVPVTIALVDNIWILVKILVATVIMSGGTRGRGVVRGVGYDTIVLRMIITYFADLVVIQTVILGSVVPIFAVVKSVVFQVAGCVWVTTAVQPLILMVGATRRGRGAGRGWLAGVRNSRVGLVTNLAVVLAIVKGLVVSLEALVHNLFFKFQFRGNVQAITAVIAIAEGTTRVWVRVMRRRMRRYLAVVPMAGARDLAISTVLLVAVRDHLVVTVLAIVQRVIVEMFGNIGVAATVLAGAAGTPGVRIRIGMRGHAVVVFVDGWDVAFPAWGRGAVVLLVVVTVLAVVQRVRVEVRHYHTAVPAFAMGTVRSPQLALSIGMGTAQLLVPLFLGGSSRGSGGKEGRVAQDETEGNELHSF